MMPAFSSVLISTRKMSLDSRIRSRRSSSVIASTSAAWASCQSMPNLAKTSFICSGLIRLNSRVWKQCAAQSSMMFCSSADSLGIVRSAQILPNLWWNASSVMTSCISLTSSGSRALLNMVAKAPMARPSTSICMPTIFL